MDARPSTLHCSPCRRANGTGGSCRRASADLEGFECQALETGAFALFTRLAVEYVFIETQHSWVSKCVNATAAAHGYVVGPPLGDNKNRLLTRRGALGLQTIGT